MLVLTLTLGEEWRPGLRLGLVYDCMVVEHPHIHMYVYTYECRSHTTPPSTSKDQRRQGSVVRQALRQLLGSLIADAVSCKTHARALSCVYALI